ncbi:MAG: replicative DNA helicase [Henriciella sp.]
MSDKTPFDPGSELAVIGSIIRYGVDHFEDVKEHLTEDDFDHPACVEIWKAFEALVAISSPVGVSNLNEYFDSTGIWGIDPEKRREYIMDAVECACSKIETIDFCKLLARISLRRNLMLAGEAISGMAEQPGTTEGMSALCERAHDIILNIEEKRQKGGEWTAANVSVMEEIDAAIDRFDNGEEPGVRVGIERLDEATGGFHDGDLVILAGRPSMGKTAVAVNLAFGAAREGKRVALFSQEMTKAQLAYRASSSEARRQKLGKIPYQDIRANRATRSQLQILRDTAKTLPASICWDATSRLSAADIRSRCRSFKKKMGGIDLVVIDYLGIMNLGITKQLNRTQAIGQVTGALKDMAKHFNVPVILLSQLSRQVEQRDNKRPMLSDLRDSGDIEQDADTVIFCYRDEYYLERNEPDMSKQTEWANWKDSHSRAENKLDLIIAKQRMGGLKTVDLYFEKETDLLVNSRTELPDHQEDLL